jgi:poly(A) polymerase
MTVDTSSYINLIPAAVLDACDVLIKDGIECRFVGGIVKEALLGHQTDDIDIAAAATPQEIQNALKKAGIKSVPTGIEHGTITVVLGNMHLEVTSLRRDVKTDGRHAVVEFGTDWHEDAKRRDLTINAIYMGCDGKIFDPFNGLDDLKNGCVRFIGDPDHRIREDYLRILRFYRFFARYGCGDVDVQSQQAILGNLDGLKHLSKERIQKEIFKILEFENPTIALQAMLDAGVVSSLWKTNGNLENLEHLIGLEHQYHIAPCALLRLYVWISNDIDFYLQHFVLSKKDQNYLKSLSMGLTFITMREVAYKFGEVLAKEVAILKEVVLGNHDFVEDLRDIHNFEKPIFPLQSKDLLDLGVNPGPMMGKMLKACEEWWIQNNFEPTHVQCMVFCKNLKEHLCAE